MPGAGVEVPTYGAPHETLQTDQRPYLAVPDTQGFQQPIQNLERSAQATQQTGGQLADTAIKMQDEQNYIRAMDAANQAREAALKLAYDPQQGYTQVKGKDVLPAGGTPLAEDYTQRFQQTIGDIANGLQNDQQKQYFALQAHRIMGSFQEGAYAHESQEWNHYTASVYQGATELSTQTIEKNYSNPNIIDGELPNIEAATIAAAQHAGISGNQTTVMVEQAKSAALTKAMAAALNDNLPGTANTLYQKYKDQLTPDDDLRIKSTIQKEVANKAIMDSADTAEMMFGAQGNQVGASGSGALAAMIRITGQSESGNQERNADGTPVTSPKGAQGRMQVMPGTAADPGHGIQPWDGKTDADKSRVGEQLLGAFVKKYGDPAKAWAAYNWSEKGVDAAVAKYGDNWLQHAPSETQAYVNKNVAALGRQGGVNAQPSLEDFYQSALGNLKTMMPEVTPEAVRSLRAEVETRWNMRKQSQNQADDQTLKQIYGALDQNGGSVGALPASLRSAIPPGRLGEVESYANAVHAGASKQTGDDGVLLMGSLLSNPQSLGTMSDSDFAALKPKLSDQDYLQLSRERGSIKQQLVKGQAAVAKDVGTLPHEALAPVLDARLSSIGLPAKIDPVQQPAMAARVAAIRMTVYNGILAEQAARGHRLNSAEVSQVVDRMFTSQAPSAGFFSTNNAPVFGIDKSHIPSGDLTQIMSSFKRRGISNPSDSDILSAYYTSQARTR